MAEDLEKQIGESPEVMFGWKDISYSIETQKGKKSILNNVNGIARSGIIAPEVKKSQSRWFTRHYGPFRVRENDTFEHFVTTIEGILGGG